MLGALLLALTPPPEPGWIQPVFEGPGLVCGRSVAFLLHKGEIARPGFSAPTVRPTQFSIELDGRTVGVWERQYFPERTVEEAFKVAGSPFTFERDEYGLVTFEHRRGDMAGVEVSFGPDLLELNERDALLARFADRPDETQCLEPVAGAGQGQ